MKPMMKLSNQLLKQFYWIVAFFLIVFFIFVGQYITSIEKVRNDLVTQEVMTVSSVNEPIQPIPLYINLDPKKVNLGNQLFHDPQLSGDETISCSSCHHLQTGGVDRLVFSPSIKGRLTTLNSPTVFNSGFNFKQNWSGNVESLEEQIDKSVSNPTSMGADWKDVMQRLQTDPNYVKMFSKIYADGITRENVKDAIGTFERSLYTPNSRFDKYLRGDTKAITAEEREGYHLFKDYGCVSCHQGVNVGGNLFQKFGIIGDAFAYREQINKADLGRFNVTGKEEDKFVFKVPGLRNISLTNPYYHDGSAKTLEEAVAIMAKYQLGRNLTGRQIELMVKFLKTLTGEYKGQPL
jgi:cytochrome c peroxidase